MARASNPSKGLWVTYAESGEWGRQERIGSLQLYLPGKNQNPPLWNVGTPEARFGGSGTAQQGAVTGYEFNHAPKVGFG